jgi:hypothetical protein
VLRLTNFRVKPPHHHRSLSVGKCLYAAVALRDAVPFTLTATFERAENRFSVPCALTKHHDMKVYWGSGNIAPLIL